jgi:hypothetical protein
MSHNKWYGLAIFLSHLERRKGIFLYPSRMLPAIVPVIGWIAAVVCSLFVETTAHKYLIRGIIFIIFRGQGNDDIISEGNSSHVGVYSYADSDRVKCFKAV